MRYLQKYLAQGCIGLSLIGLMYMQLIQKLPSAELQAKSLTATLIKSKAELGLGIAQKILFKGKEYDALIISLEEAKLYFYYKNEQGKRLKNFGNLQKHLHAKGKQLLFATNAGIFKPNFEPEGLYVEHRKEITKLNLKRGKGNFYMQPNGVFFLTSYKTANIIPSSLYPNVKKVSTFATQSGPLLVYNHQINPHFSAKSESKYIRNGVGILPQNQVIFLISNEAVSLHEFANVFKEYYQCPRALYLDGAISQMYLPIFKRNELKGDFGAMIGIVK